MGSREFQAPAISQITPQRGYPFVQPRAHHLTTAPTAIFWNIEMGTFFDVFVSCPGCEQPCPEGIWVCPNCQRHLCCGAPVAKTGGRCGCSELARERARQHLDARQMPIHVVEQRRQELRYLEQHKKQISLWTIVASVSVVIIVTAWIPAAGPGQRVIRGLFVGVASWVIASAIWHYFRSRARHALNHPPDNPQ